MSGGIFLVKMVSLQDHFSGRGQFLDKKFAAQNEDHAAAIARRLYPEYTVLAVESEDDPA